MRKFVLGAVIAILASGLPCFAETYEDVYNSAWETVNKYYYSPYFDSKEWNNWKTRYQDKINTKEDLECAASTMLESLNDPYTYFTTPIETNYTQERKNKKIGSQKDITGVPPIEKIDIPKNIKYIRIKSFSNRNTSNNFYKLVKNPKKHEGYIIDLRWNGGGMVKMAAEIANMFLKDTLIVSTKDKEGNLKEYPANSITLPYKPIVILINEHTASASEIMAAAFQENNRAIIIGETSFGKGIVQEFEELPLGYGINYTHYQYLTPKGNFIHKKGVSPDIEIAFTRDDFYNKKDPQLRKAIEVLSNKLNKNN